MADDCSRLLFDVSFCSERPRVQRRSLDLRERATRPTEKSTRNLTADAFCADWSPVRTRVTLSNGDEESGRGRLRTIDALRKLLVARIANAAH